jgi:hypothetical protein
MVSKRVVAIVAWGLLAAPLFAGLVEPKMDSIYRFRGIKVPMNLKIQDVIVEAGVFDLEFLKAADSNDLYLKLFRKGEVLDLIKGEEWPYEGGDPVDGKPKLKMVRSSSQGRLVFTFESGKDHRIFPLIRARFSVPYSE